MADSDAPLSFFPAPEAPADEDLIRTYRQVAGQMVRPVAVVACLRGRQPHAVTVDSFLDVSYDPPTMAVSIYSGSRMMESLEIAEAMTISVLAAEQKNVAQWLGEPGQPLYGVLDTVPTHAAPSGVPYIAGAAAVFDCRITNRLEIATHTLVVGEARSCAETVGVRPLARWQDDYGTVTGR
ncbi:flavin reductase family protein [Brevibacterium sp. p3-SID960]|uniref:flavin reductase family protein n=1 Tax=Brevibacterium sp. p3-SID960 TaxID=2916063 RepID=UPI0021A34C5B|nr:flavin reductase family protein [Brevibacterium sp. p3-SID960]MCT1691221.1 flavin reductase family protein [Brevibacterium sp. p3-SID960]